MIEKQYSNVNPCKLQDELISAGLIVGSFVTFDLGNDTAQIQFNDDVDLILVESIVAKHDKTPLPQPKSGLEIAQDNISSLGSQLFEAQTQILQAESDKVMLGQQLFSLQTQLMTKGVI